MNSNLTEIVFVLDRSGSMNGLESDTIGGFNSFVESQKSEVGEARLTTVLFDDQYEVLHDGVDIQKVPTLTEKEYFSRGMTAMLDAIGKTINDIGSNLAKKQEEDRPGKVIFVITTDGMENSSTEFKKKQIKKMIEHQQDKYNWKFLFLGANIDAFDEAGGIGISKAHAANFTANGAGVMSHWLASGFAVSSVRKNKGGEVDASWSDGVK